MTSPRARGVCAVNLARMRGALERAVIRSKLGEPCTARHHETTLRPDMRAGATLTLDGMLRPR